MQNKYFLLLFVTLLTACQLITPQASKLSQTIKGVTLNVTDIKCTLIETVITFTIQVGPEWNLSIDSDRPSGVMLNDPILVDEGGKQYTPRASTYGIAQSDDSTGGMRFENMITFEPISGSSNTITFQTEIEILGIPVSPSFEISLLGRQPLDTWPLEQGITFSNFANLPVNVKLTYKSASRVDLEFTYERITSDGLLSECLHFWPDSQTTTNYYADCTADENKIVSRLGMDLPSDKTSLILLHITGSVIITEPFAISWSVTGR